jgi:hypothetical protein
MYREIKGENELSRGEVYWIEYVVWENPETDFVMSGVGVLCGGNSKYWFQNVHGEYLATLDRVRRIWAIEGPEYEHE